MGSVKSERKAAAARKNGSKNRGGLVKAGSCESMIKQANYISSEMHSSKPSFGPTCQHFSGCLNPGFQSKGRTAYLCNEHS